MSSGINSMSAQMLGDMVKPAYKKITKRPLPERVSAMLAKTFGQ